MDNFDLLLDQMATDLSMQAGQLELSRQQLFLSWLKSHSTQVRDAFSIPSEIPGRESLEHYLKNGLKGWLESFPQQGLFWEYRLILDEIAWWRDVDPNTLTRILSSKGKD